MNLVTVSIKFKKWFPALLLLIFYFSEAFSKYALAFLEGKSDIQRFIKLLALVFFVFTTLKSFKKLLLPFSLLVVFCLGQFFLAEGFNQEIVVSFSKLLFPIFLLIYFNEYPLNIKSQRLLFQTFEYILIFNGLLIIMGLVFDITLFNSYKFNRWGFNGLFINTSTSSYIYAIAIFYFLLSLKKSFLKNWKSIFIICCSVLTGTKIVYIALFGSLLIYFLFYTNLNRKLRIIVLASISISFALLCYVIFFHWGIFNEIRQNQGLFSAILSFRDDLLLEVTLPYINANWEWYNYLFGGISNLALRSQMGFIDIFLFWGIIGGLLYLFTFYKSFAANPIVNNGVYIIFILTLMVFLAGNFFENASVAIYLLILKEKLIKDKEVSF